METSEETSQETNEKTSKETNEETSKETNEETSKKTTKETSPNRQVLLGIVRIVMAIGRLCEALQRCRCEGCSQTAESPGASDFRLPLNVVFASYSLESVPVTTRYNLNTGIHRLPPPVT